MNTDHSGGRKADVPLYFFILGLTPALGVSHSLIHSVVMSGFLLILLLVQGPLLSLVGYKLPDRLRFPTLFGFNLLLVGLLDYGVSVVFPELYGGFGIYLKIMAVNPLILKILNEQARGWSLTESLGYAIKTSFGFLVFALGLSLAREILGSGQITYGFSGESFKIPFWNLWSLKVLTISGGGALLLAGLIKGFQNWAYYRGALWMRQDEPQGILEQKSQRRAEVQKTQVPVIQKPSRPQIPEKAPERPLVVEPPAREAPVPLPPETRVENEVPVTQVTPPPVTPVEAPVVAIPPVVETTRDAAQKQETEEIFASEEPPIGGVSTWGEQWPEVLAQLAEDKSFEKKRVLVVGCGTGEIVYSLAMGLADAKGKNPRFSFRIRGVDAFSARIESAKEGIYRESLLSELSLDQKQRYLLQNKEEGKRLVRIGQDIRQYVEFLVSEYLAPGYFFLKPSEVIYINQSMDFMTPEEKVKLLELCRGNMITKGALILPSDWPRDLVPVGFRRTGNSVFRKESEKEA